MKSAEIGAIERRGSPLELAIASDEPHQDLTELSRFAAPLDGRFFACESVAIKSSCRIPGIQSLFGSLATDSPPRQ